MSSATKAVAASSAMLPLVTAQTVASERGSEDEFRDEEHFAARFNDKPQLALYAAIDIVSDLTLGSA